MVTFNENVSFLDYASWIRLADCSRLVKNWWNDSDTTISQHSINSGSKIIPPNYPTKIRVNSCKFWFEKISILILSCFFSLFVLYSFYYGDLLNSLLRSLDSFWLSFADKVTKWRYSFVSFIVKLVLLELEYDYQH